MRKSIDGKKKIVDALVKMIESKKLDWSKPWIDFSNPPTRENGERYTGINAFILGITAQCQQYKSKYWLTYNKCEEIGAHVRKGEKATTVCYYTQFTPADQKHLPKEEQKQARMIKVFNVFNGDQIENLPEKYAAEELPTAPMSVEAVEQFVERTGANVETNVTYNACYIPSLDRIQMPTSEQFESPESWAATMLHELTHWTGTKERCNRGSLTTDRSSEGYAKEELVAELGACFMAQELGVTTSPREESAAYLQSWLKKFKSDPNYLFEAYAEAAKAAKFCTENQMVTA